MTHPDALADRPAEPLSYDQDFYAWLMRNAELLKSGKLSEIDAGNIAEELESMGKRDKRQLISRLIVLFTHLLKWEFQPDHRSGIDFQKINCTRKQGGDCTGRASPTDDAVKLFFWKSISWKGSVTEQRRM